MGVFNRARRDKFSLFSQIQKISIRNSPTPSIMLTKAFLLLFSLLPVATFAVETMEVFMVAAHESQCTHENSSCVSAIRDYVATYYPNEQMDGSHRDLWDCITGGGGCDPVAPDYLLCRFFNGCTRRNLNEERRANHAHDLFTPPSGEVCYLAGHLEDEKFSSDIIEDLGEDCPCVAETHFNVRVCESD